MAEAVSVRPAVSRSEDCHNQACQVLFLFTLEVAVYSITGVLAARLVTRYGARAVCVAGALVSASGLVLASYSSSLAILLLTYSLVTGLGFGETLLTFDPDMT